MNVSRISGRCLFENVSEELSHAFFVSLLFKVHIGHEALGFGVAIGTFQQHAQIFQRADVTLTDVNHKAWIGLLLECHFSTFLFWSDFNPRLRDINSLLVQIRSDLDCRETFLDAIDRICYTLSDVLSIVVFILILLLLSIFVDNNFDSLVDNLALLD